MKPPRHQRTLLADQITASTDEATPGLRELVSGSGVSLETLSSWRRGVRIPSPSALQSLARKLEEQAMALLEIAESLSETAQDLRTPAGRAWVMLPAEAVYQLGQRDHAALRLRLKEAVARGPDTDPEEIALALLQTISPAGPNA